MFESRTLSVSVNCAAKKVYDFASEPSNLPSWAKAFCRSIKKAGGDWIAETPQGPMKLRFAEKNNLGVLDHHVSPDSGTDIYVPMRVVPNDRGSEILFTLFRPPDMPDDEFAKNVLWVERDLKSLKGFLES
jgi:hypothetical protein